MLEAYVLRFHDLDEQLEGDNHVGVDDRPSLPALVYRESAGVNDAHLLDDGRLAGLSSACG